MIIENNNFTIGWPEYTCKGVIDNNIIIEPIAPPRITLQTLKFLFKRMAVK